jgi:hypothetical protein
MYKELQMNWVRTQAATHQTPEWEIALNAANLLVRTKWNTPEWHERAHRTAHALAVAVMATPALAGYFDEEWLETAKQWPEDDYRQYYYRSTVFSQYFAVAYSNLLFPKPETVLLPEIAATFREIKHNAGMQGHPIALRVVHTAIGLEPVVAIEYSVPTNDMYPHYQWSYYMNTPEGLAAIRRDYAAYL